MTMNEIPEPYVHLLEMVNPSLEDLELALQRVYRSRVEDVTSEARAGVTLLKEQLENYTLDHDEVKARQEGLQDIASALAKDLYEEYQTARVLLRSQVTQKIVGDVVKRTALMGALVVTGGVVLTDLLRRLR